MTSRQLDLCICEIATGKREALRQLYDEFKNPIFLFALSLVKNYQTAEDVEQETFIQIMQSAHKYQQGTNAKAWIFSIARNCCSDSMKKAAKYVPLENDILPDLSASADEFDKVENALIALEALDVLDETEKTIVSLYFYAELKQTEIAKILHIPYLSVRSKYGYAMKKLKRYFEKKGVRNNEKKNYRETNEESNAIKSTGESMGKY